jgi:dienelactone hydrolase
MGTIILIVAFAIEAAFAAYCIITKSNQMRTRSLIRIGALGAFAIFTLVSVLEWGLRWYGLAALLLVWAGVGVWTLSGKRMDGQAYQSRRVVFKAARMLVLLWIALIPALIFPQGKSLAMTGKYQVATATYTYTDKSRTETFTSNGESREVEVEFWYPENAAGKYPLVVFSPGSFGTRTSNTSTYRELASNGYVVSSIDHPYHSFFTTNAGGKLTLISWTFFQEAMGVNNDKYDVATKFGITQEWMKVRTGDISFALNTVLERAADSASGKVYQMIDTEKIGLMGHSLGGAAVVRVARDRHDIDAVINLDADLIGEYSLVNGKTVVNREIYPVPILSIYSNDMVNLLVGIKDPNNVIAGKYIAATAPHAYEIHIAGTNHLSLTDLPITSPFLMYVLNRSVHVGGGVEADKYAVLAQMNGFALEFFNLYLKGEGDFTSAGTP